MDNETKLTELIARYPNRWRQAVANPALRGWFVHKMTGRGAPMTDRAAASYAIDCRARQENLSQAAKVSNGSKRQRK